MGDNGKKASQASAIRAIDCAQGPRLYLARSKFARTVGIAAFALLAATVPGRANGVDASASYVISLGGLNVATVGVTLKDAAHRYDISLDAHVAGLANLVTSGTAKVEASGVTTATTLESRKFDLLTKSGGQHFSIGIEYDAGNVTSFRVEPALVDQTNRVPIERRQLTGVGDMLSAFIVKGGALDRALCTRTMHIFTGVERFDIALSFIGKDTATSLRTAYQGPVVACRIKYTPISGHFTTSAMTNYLAASDHMLIWYAPLGTTRFFIPYRILIATTFGDLSMVLTDLKY